MLWGRLQTREELQFWEVPGVEKPRSAGDGVGSICWSAAGGILLIESRKNIFREKGTDLFKWIKIPQCLFPLSLKLFSAHGFFKLPNCNMYPSSPLNIKSKVILLPAVFQKPLQTGIPNHSDALSLYLLGSNQTWHGTPDVLIFYKTRSRGGEIWIRAVIWAEYLTLHLNQFPDINPSSCYEGTNGHTSLPHNFLK